MAGWIHPLIFSPQNLATMTAKDLSYNPKDKERVDAQTTTGERSNKLFWKTESEWTKW